MATELIVIDKANELEFFAEDGSEKALQLVKNHLVDFVPDTTTDKGRKLIASNASKVGKSRKVLDDMGKRIRKNTLDSEKKRKIIFDEYQEEVREPLTEWETQKAEDDRIEAERIDNIQSHLDELKQTSCVVDNDGGLLDWDTLQLAYQQLDTLIIDEETYQEFKSQAEDIKATNLEIIESAMARRKKFDDDQAALAAFREQEEKKQRELEVLSDIADANEHTEDESTESTVETVHNKPVAGEIYGGSFLHEGMSDDVAVNSPSSVSEQPDPVRQDAPTKRTPVDFNGVASNEESGICKQVANHGGIINREDRRKVFSKILQSMVAFGLSDEQAKNLVASMVAGNIPHVTVEY